MIKIVKIKSPNVTAEVGVRRIVMAKVETRRGPRGKQGEDGVPGPPGNLENMQNLIITGGFF